MANPLDNVKAMLVLLVMPGCEHCDEFKPRFERYVDHFQKHNAPLVDYTPGQSIRRGTIPVMVIDATSDDPNIQAFCDLHKVSGMPTLLLLTHNRAPVKIEGAVEDGRIYEVLTSAVLAAR